MNDIVQLNAYLYNTIGTSFKYVNYIPNQKKIIIAAVQDLSWESETALQTAISDALNAYTNPSPPTRIPGTIQTTSLLKTNTVAPYSGNMIAIEAVLSAQNNRIINVAPPLSVTDCANRAYVDSISAGSGLSKDLLGPTFNVNIDSSLYFDGNNQVGISSAALTATTVDIPAGEYRCNVRLGHERTWDCP